MKNNLGTRVLVGVAVLCALGATGCRSGWKVGNPFSKAPKASSVDTPSELDELDLTPPPENYTTSDRSKNNPDEKSLAQKGKYEAPETQKSAAESTQALPATQNLVADARANGGNSVGNGVETAVSPTDNFQAPSYSQDYQSAQNYNTAQNTQDALNTSIAQNTSTAQNTQNYQAPRSYQASPSYQTAPFDAAPTQDFAQNAGQNQTQTDVYQQSSLNVAQNNYPNNYPNNYSNETQNAPFPTIDSYYSTLNVASQANSIATTAPTSNVPNQFSTAPVVQTSATIPANDAARQSAFVAQNFPDAPTPGYQAAPVAATPFPTADSFAGTYGAPSQVSQNTQITQSQQTFPNAAPTQNAQTSDAYSNVYYQQQTTSGGFAPGSVGLY